MTTALQRTSLGELGYSPLTTTSLGALFLAVSIATGSISQTLQPIDQALAGYTAVSVPVTVTEHDGIVWEHTTEDLIWKVTTPQLLWEQYTNTLIWTGTDPKLVWEQSDIALIAETKIPEPVPVLPIEELVWEQQEYGILWVSSAPYILWEQQREELIYATEISELIYVQEDI